MTGRGGFLLDRRTATGLALLGLIAAATLVAPLLPGAGAVELTDIAVRRFTAPLARTPDGILHLLGTDRFGRDVLVRLLLAGRISLAVGVLAALVAAVVGVAFGAVAGWRGGTVDRVLAALTDAVLAVPRVPLLLLLVALSRPGMALTVLAIGCTGWTTIARLVRADVRRLRTREFVEAARALGVAGPRLLVRHVLPHALTPALVATALGVGHAIMLEAGLSFLGLGVQPPAASWGNMIAAGRDALVLAPWVALAPATMVVAVVLATSLVADGLEARLAGER